ncbi:MAG: polysaccharide biosynthesis protein [Nocardioides sp.]|nr:polysaccharide biosynthesis protein [Nocardioides sp.]
MTVSGTSPSAVDTRSLSRASVLMVLGKAFQMGFGFLFWIVAARLTSVAGMGTVAATVSAVMLVTQIGLLGVGATMIVSIGRGEPVGQVLDTGFTVVTATSLLAAGGYVAFTMLGRGDVATTQSATPFQAMFLVAAVCGTVAICLDQAGIALGRPSGTVVRYVLGGVVMLGGLAAAAAASRGDLSTGTVFGVWTLSSVVICVAGGWQLSRWVGYRYRGRVRIDSLRRHLAVGVPNHLLTLTERLPALLVPLLVAYLVSPEATAYWYPAWMLAWVAYTVPIQVGLVQFSEGVRRPGDLRRTLRSGFVSGLALGGLAAVLLAVLAHPLLALIGADYADSSATALRVLTLGIIPFTVWQSYNARCRAAGLVREGIMAGLVLAGIICLATVWAAPRGSTALAVAWVASSSLGAVWAARRLTRRELIR